MKRSNDWSKTERRGQKESRCLQYKNAFELKIEWHKNCFKGKEIVKQTENELEK